MKAAREVDWPLFEAAVVAKLGEMRRRAARLGGEYYGQLRIEWRGGVLAVFEADGARPAIPFVRSERDR